MERGAFIFCKKLSYLRQKLRHCAKRNFCSIKLRKLALLHDFDEMDILKEMRKLNQSIRGKTRTDVTGESKGNSQAKRDSLETNI